MRIDVTMGGEKGGFGIEVYICMDQAYLRRTFLLHSDGLIA
jgi:hypothetical protein